MRSIFVRWYLGAVHVSSVPRNWIYCLIHGVKYSPSWRFMGLPFIQKRRGGSIVIGRNFKACSKSKYNSIGVFQRVVLKVGRRGSITIGENVGISGCSISSQSSIKIGNNVLIGSGVLITDSDAHALNPVERLAGKPGASLPIIIEDDVFIGARAIVLKGITIGKGSVVGAGAVVTKDVPDFSVVAGNPAKVVGRVK